MKIRIKYFAEGLTPVEKLVQGDWIDLRAAETVEMQAGEYRLISLGVSMKLPAGYEAHVRQVLPQLLGAAYLFDDLLLAGLRQYQWHHAFPFLCDGNGPHPRPF